MRERRANPGSLVFLEKASGGDDERFENPKYALRRRKSNQKWERKGGVCVGEGGKCPFKFCHEVSRSLGGGLVTCRIKGRNVQCPSTGEGFGKKGKKSQVDYCIECACASGLNGMSGTPPIGGIA